jgi:hypothetical protein
MDKGQIVKTVNNNLRTKIFSVPILGLYFLLLAAPIYISVKSRNVVTVVFCLVFIAFCIWFIIKNKPVSYLISAFQPAFTIYEKGLEANQNLFIEWNKVKEISVFEHFGEKHFGFRLKEDVARINGVEIGEYLKNNSTWSVYKMPLAVSCNSLSQPWDEVVELIHSKFNVPVVKQNVSDEVKFTET